MSFLEYFLFLNNFSLPFLFSLSSFLSLSFSKDDLMNLPLPQSPEFILVIEINQANLASKISFTTRFLSFSWSYNHMILLVLLRRTLHCCLPSFELSTLKHFRLLFLLKINWFIWHSITPFLSFEIFAFDRLCLCFLKSFISLDLWSLV